MVAMINVSTLIISQRTRRWHEHQLAYVANVAVSPPPYSRMAQEARDALPYWLASIALGDCRPFPQDLGEYAGHVHELSALFPHQSFKNSASLMRQAYGQAETYHLGHVVADLLRQLNEYRSLYRISCEQILTFIWGDQLATIVSTSPDKYASIARDRLILPPRLYTNATRPSTNATSR